MNSNPTRTLAISIGAGVFAMFLVYSYLQEHKAEYDKLYGTTKRIVVASKPILEMSTINDTMIEYMEVPVNFVQPGAMTNPEEVISMIAGAPIQEGEQILSTKLLTPGPITGLSNQIAPEKRAITIPIDDVRGVAKLLRPGDRVDILAAIERNRRTEVKTILQDIVVLATGLNITNNIPRTLELDSLGNAQAFRNLNGDTSFSTVTVEVTPKQAQDIILLQIHSGVFLALRNRADRSKRVTSPSTVDSILGRSSVRRPTAMNTKKVPLKPKTNLAKNIMVAGLFREVK